MATQTHPAAQQLTVPLSAIVVDEGFNPRSDLDRSELTRLAKSIEQHGLIQPLVVTPHEEGYRLIDGERRYRACGEAKLVEVPVIVRVADEDTGALDVALVANTERVELSPVDEAKAFQRLLDSGLTRKGIVDRCGVSQKLVSERLALLTLDEDLYPQISEGTIPPGAIRPLVELAKIHPGLPARAVAEIAAVDSGDYGQEPYTWSDLARQPLEVAIADPEQLPAEVYVTGLSYPVERFTLTEEATRDSAKWAQLEGRDPSGLSVSFTADDVAAAEKLGAAHRGVNGWTSVIVGQDVAEQLVCDQVKHLFKQARESAKRTANASAAVGGSGGASDDGRSDGAVEEETAKEQRRAEREAQQQARREAAAHNAELGAACVKQLARLKVDERVVRILSAFDLGSELDKIALRGGRYGLPGWVGQQERKMGDPKPVYLDRGDAEAKAREFVRSAKTAAEVGGRQVVLLAMARYADEQAIAQSQRSFYSLSPGRQLPFSDEVIDTLDELCAEKLPAHVLDRGREERERQAAERAKDREDRAWLKQQYAGLEAMSPEQRESVLKAHEERFGPYGGQRWQLEQRVRQLAETEAPKTEGADDAGSGEGGDTA